MVLDLILRVWICVLVTLMAEASLRLWWLYEGTNAS